MHYNDQTVVRYSDYHTKAKLSHDATITCLVKNNRTEREVDPINAVVKYVIP